ncbi:MAG TPA: hypothetical protein VFH51_02935, partial [Myxococcota bacterium]|nr:hypothetical protein [Myxococcota bacterium]
VRFAYTTWQADPTWQNRLAGVKIRSVFEMAPVDGQSGALIEARGVPWGVFLPQCDGDVYNLAGMRPFDRMIAAHSQIDPAPKTVLVAWGANHNAANSVWAPTPDNVGCAGPNNTAISTQAEQDIVSATLISFFRGTVGSRSDPNFLRLFNPIFDLPAGLSTTRLDRTYLVSTQDAASRMLNDFSRPGGVTVDGVTQDAAGLTVSYGPLDNLSAQDVVTHSRQSAALIQWRTADAGNYVQFNWRSRGDGDDLRRTATIDWRMVRRDTINTSNNPTTATDFSVQLVQGDGKLSDPLPVATYFKLVSPVGTQIDSGSVYHLLLGSVRIALRDFSGVGLQAVRGVRLTFDSTPFGDIGIADLQLSSRYE